MEKAVNGDMVAGVVPSPPRGPNLPKHGLLLKATNANERLSTNTFMCLFRLLQHGVEVMAAVSPLSGVEVMMLKLPLSGVHGMMTAGEVMLKMTTLGASQARVRG